MIKTRQNSCMDVVITKSNNYIINPKFLFKTQSLHKILMHKQDIIIQIKQHDSLYYY